MKAQTLSKYECTYSCVELFWNKIQLNAKWFVFDKLWLRFRCNLSVLNTFASLLTNISVLTDSQSASKLRQLNVSFLLAPSRLKWSISNPNTELRTVGFSVCTGHMELGQIIDRGSHVKDRFCVTITLRRIICYL